MRDWLVLVLMPMCTLATWSPPVNLIPTTASITATGLDRDWMWMDAGTSFDILGDFSVPAGYKIWTSSVLIYDSSDVLVATVPDPPVSSSIVTVAVPILSDIGQHCMTFSMQLGTFDYLNLFTITALGGPLCFISAPRISTLTSVSVSNGPPSGGTPVSFSFDIVYPSTLNVVDFDCVFGSLYSPMTYTVPSAAGSFSLSGTCESAGPPVDRFVCVQLVPRNTSSIFLPQTQTGYACSDPSEFAYSYYEQMPVPTSIDLPNLPYTGGQEIVVEGASFPDAESTSVIFIKVGSYLDIPCTKSSPTTITCPNVPSASAAGIGAAQSWTAPVSVSFNNGWDYSIKYTELHFVPFSTIASSVPRWGEYVAASTSVVSFAVSYTDPAMIPISGPLAVCYYEAEPLSSSDAPDSLLPISWQTEMHSFQATLPAPPSSLTDSASVYVSLKQEDGVCDWENVFTYVYRPGWSVTEFNQAIISGGSMSVAIVGTNLFQEDTESLCRVAAVWPATSAISAAQPCYVFGTMKNVQSTSGTCDFSLGTSFYQCGYLAAQTATQSEPSDLFLWDTVNLDVAIAMNGVDYSPLQPSGYIRAIRLPVIKNLSPDFGFNYGGFVVEVELQTGVAWHVQQCRFLNVLTGVSRLVRAVPFSIRTVVCVAPKWKLTAASVEFQVALLIDGTTYSSPAIFTMLQAPMVRYASPREGPISGYTRISITGTDFDQIFARGGNIIDLQCVFALLPEPKMTPGYYVSATEVECLTPPTGSAGYVVVDISVNWMSGSSNRLASVSLHQEIFHYIPSVVDLVSISLLSGPRTGGSLVTFTTTTTLLNNGLVRCAFGEIFVKAEWLSSTSVLCISPPSSVPGTVTMGLSLDSQTVVPFYFSNALGNQTMGATGPSYFLYYHPPIVSSTSPQFGTVSGDTSVMFRGAHFRNTPETKCRFGSVLVDVLLFISSHALVCTAPTGSLGDVELAVTNNGVDYVSGTSYMYTYVEAQPFLLMFPFMGPISGGTVVEVTPADLNIPSSALTPGSTPKCSFGSYFVSGQIIDVNTGVMACTTPPVATPGYYSVAIYYNGQDATFVSQKYFYHDLITIETVDPPLGPQGVPNMVTVIGTNFINTEYLTVRFGTENVGYEDVPGVWMSDTTIRAISPAYSPAVDSLRLPVMVSNNGVDYTPSEIATWNPNDDLFDILGVIRYYTLHVPMILKLADPSWANMHGGGYISVHGGPFMNTGLISCGFDWIASTELSPVFISASEILCPVPDMWAAGAGSSLTRTARLQVALVGIEWSDSFLEFEFLPVSPAGYFTPHLDQDTYTNNLVPCGVGYQCPQAGLSAPLQCTPGTYQPSPGKLQCVVCPIGYFCSQVRMEAPTMCPPGWVCDEDGLVSPYKRCPAGYICLQGTSTMDPLPEEPLNALSPSEANAGYNAPYRCLQGMYCLEGVVAFVSIPGNFSTPQPCYQGSYCKPGSDSPFGAGSIPLGRFSTSPENPGTLCPARFACGPATGNVEPHPCEPGSYNFYSGQHNCTLAYEGSIAPAPMQVRPLPTDCGHQGGRKGIFALSEIDLCPSATTCGYGVASNNEPPICFPVLSTDPAVIASVCKLSSGQIYWPANTFSNLRRIDATVANCCWAYPVVTFFAEKIAQAYEKNPFGEGYEGKSARRWKQRIGVLSDQLLAGGYPAGFDGIQMIETVNKVSLLTFFGVHCARVRERIVYNIERYFLFKAPEFCAPGTFCNPGTCSAFPTVNSVSTFF